MRKIFLAVILIISGVASLSAWERPKTVFGIRAGMNLARVGIETDENHHVPKVRPGFHAGAFTQIPVIEHWYLNTGLYLSTKGYIDDQKEFVGKYKREVNSTYLQIPVYAMFRVELYHKMHLRLNLGPYFAYGIGGTEKTEYRLETVKKDCFGDDGVYKRFDWGLGGSIGVGYRHMIFDIGYEHGFTNFSKEDLIEIRNRATTFTVGYVF